MPFPLMAVLAGAGGLGKIFGGAAKGSADERASNNDLIARRNALMASLYGTRQNATMNAAMSGSREQSDHANIDLDRRRHALAAPGVRGRQAVRGSLMQHLQPVSFSGLNPRINVPTMTGGLTPAALGPEVREMGALLSRQAILDQLEGDEFTPLKATNFNDAVLATPPMENYQRSGLMEKILGGLGLAGSIAGGVGEAVGGMPRGRSRDSYAYRTPPYFEEDV